MEISVHLGAQASRWRCFSVLHKAVRPGALEMQGVCIRRLLNQLKICIGTADQLLFIYFYLELANSVKFHNGQMNTVFMSGLGAEEDLNMRWLGFISLSCFFK